MLNAYPFPARNSQKDKTIRNELQSIKCHPPQKIGNYCMHIKLKQSFPYEVSLLQAKVLLNLNW